MQLHFRKPGCMFGFGLGERLARRKLLVRTPLMEGVEISAFVLKSILYNYIR